jgi:hypothetical protein
MSYLSDRYCTLVRPVEPISKQVWSTGLVQSLYRVPETITKYVQPWTRQVRQTIWQLEFELHQTSLTYNGHVRVLTKICQFREFPSESALSLFDRSALTSPTASFLNSYKRHSTPSLVGCWFLTIWITFQQSLELSPTSLCEIQVLCERFLSWVDSFYVWALEF